MKNSTKAMLVAGAVGAGAVLVYLVTRPQPQGLTAKFSGFEAKIIDSDGTTTRQSTGETAIDFQFYPLIDVTPDVNGNYTITWRFVNAFDGAQTVDSGTITNMFSGLIGGQPVRLQLVDNRPGNPGGIPGPRDTDRNGAIAIGDKDFAGLGKQDGNWHSFASAVTVTVTSPSGATRSVSGILQDNFKSVGALSASFAGFALNKIT